MFDPESKLGFSLNTFWQFPLKTNLMAIIASFTNISSSYIIMIHKLCERKMANYFAGQSFRLKGRPLNSSILRNESKIFFKSNRKSQILKIHLDNILNNLCDTTPREKKNPECRFKDASYFLASYKRMSQQFKKMCEAWHLYVQLLEDQDFISQNKGPRV